MIFSYFIAGGLNNSDIKKREISAPVKSFDSLLIFRSECLYIFISFFNFYCQYYIVHIIFLLHFLNFSNIILIDIFLKKFKRFLVIHF